ncbi:uncharacterized membrane protein, partial [Tanacetum coccineum]
EGSFKRGMAYVIALVAKFDEYMKDWFYLREGSVFSKPIYGKKKVSQLPEIDISVGGSRSSNGKHNVFAMQAPGVIVIPSLSSSISVKDVKREVKVVQGISQDEGDTLDNLKNISRNVSCSHLNLVAIAVWKAGKYTSMIVVW